MKKLILILVASILAMACNLNATYSGQESDRKAAEKVTNDFYNYIIEADYDSAERLFSDKFFETTPKESLQMIFTKTKEVLGDFKSNKLVEWDAKEIVGSNAKTEYVLVYEVQYTNYKAIETIALVKENGEEEIKIFGYHVNSEGFLK